MELEFWATTDVGRVRDHNEDNFLVDKRMKLFVVCDGMGGHAAGEVASAMSVKIVREVLSSHREVFERLENDPDNLANRKSVLTLVEHAIHEACARVYHSAQEDASRRGMGTTCSLLLLAQGRGFIGHVGDSRIYLFRQGAVHQITDDHSLINEMIRLGKIKKGEEHNLPHKNAVTRAVGVNEFVEVDTFELDVFGGDSFLLCSDGLSGYFTADDQIGDLLDQEDVKQITEDCIDFANAGGGKDNITAIVVRVTDGGMMNTRDIQRMMEVMRATPFFQYLGYKEMVQMVNLSRREELSAGEQVFSENSDPGGMYLIVNGEVTLQRAGKNIATLMPGEYFGEMSIIDETPQSVAAQASQDVVLLMFSRDRFMELLRQQPGLAVKLLWNFLQTFTSRMRGVPYEQLLRVETGADEPTPPSGTLVFEEEVGADAGHQPSSVSGEFVAPDFDDRPQSGGGASSDPRPLPPKPGGGSSSDAKASSSPRKTPNETQKQARPGSRQPTRQGRPGPKTRGDHDAKTIPTSQSMNPDAQAQSFSGSNEADPDATVDIGDRDALFEGMEWDDIVPGNILDSEAENADGSLRETVQMDREAETTQPNAMASPDATMEMDDLRKTIPSSDMPKQSPAKSQPESNPGGSRSPSGSQSNSSSPSQSSSKSGSASNGASKAISGESVVKNKTPEAQVLKRTKLVVGERNDFENTERTSEVKPLQERKSDSTLELELDDDNVEEIN